jgi:hypothetical protein
MLHFLLDAPAARDRMQKAARSLCQRLTNFITEAFGIFIPRKLWVFQIVRDVDGGLTAGIFFLELVLKPTGPAFVGARQPDRVFDARMVVHRAIILGFDYAVKRGQQIFTPCSFSLPSRQTTGQRAARRRSHPARPTRTPMKEDLLTVAFLFVACFLIEKASAGISLPESIRFLSSLDCSFFSRDDAFIENDAVELSQIRALPCKAKRKKVTR